MSEVGGERDEVARDTLAPCYTLLKHARRKSMTQIMDAWTAQSALANACFSQDNHEGAVAVLLLIRFSAHRQEQMIVRSGKRLA